MIRELKSVIKSFNDVRDLPLKMPENIRDVDLRCWGKARRLYDLLNSEGLNVRFRVAEFDWTKQNLPEEIVAKVPNKIDQHLFVEAEINGSWACLDPANDSNLPNSNKWDGKFPCKLCVNHIKTFSVYESERLEKQEKLDYRNNFEKYKEFYTALNRFLDKAHGVRK